MFSKIDKKVLTILIIVAVIAVLLIFAAYKYLTLAPNAVENKTGGAQTIQTAPDDNQNQQNYLAPDVQIEAQGENGNGQLLVCQDKCGDGVCQKVDNNCGKGSTSCICPEEPKECPQDCQ